MSGGPEPLLDGGDRGRGWRAFNPSDKSVNAFCEAGDATSESRDIVRQGPYVKYQWRGNKSGFRVPAAGIPNPLSGDVGEIPEISAWRMPIGGGIDIPGSGRSPGSPLNR